MSGTQLHQLSAAYALDALDSDECRRFEAHLETCSRCRREVETFGQTTAVLAGALAEPPPVDLRARVLAAATGLPQLDERTGDRAIDQDSRPTERSARRRRTALLLATAAAVVLLIAAATVMLTRRSSEMDVAELLRDSRTSVIALNGPSGETARVVWSRENGQAVLLANRLPAIRTDEVYEVWFIDDGQPRPGPTVSANGPDIEHRFAVASSPPQSIAVTIEPAPGTAKAVGPVILSGATPK